MSLGIVGVGRMGRALARAAAASAEPVVVCSARADPRSMPALPPGCVVASLDQVWRFSRTVVLAVPFPVAMALVSGPAGRHGDGRTLIDATNPGLHPDRPLPPDVSGGELIAEAAVAWQVAKAFNTVAADQMPIGGWSGEPVPLPVGGSPAAKADVFPLARRLGFEPVDAGDIRASRELESLAVLLARISAAHENRGGIGLTMVRPRAFAQDPS
jgi:8-hydroxy-5-deazaflavin:NADPH oxidoreductase